MKNLITIAFFIVTGSVNGQTQDWEQLKLNLEKLAQFKLMLSQMTSGYQSLQNAYQRIGDIGKSHYTLHRQFLDAQWQVSPGVARDPAIGRVQQSQAQLLVDSRKLLLVAQRSGLFSAAEINVLSQSCQEIQDAVTSDIALLGLVLTSGELRMSDSERAQTIQTVERSVAQQVLRWKRMEADYARLIALRRQQKKDTESMKGLYKK